MVDSSTPFMAAASLSPAAGEKKHWWLTSRKMVERYVREAKMLVATQEQGDVAAALGLLEAALAVAPRMEVASLPGVSWDKPPNTTVLPPALSSMAHTCVSSSLNLASSPLSLYSPNPSSSPSSTSNKFSLPLQTPRSRHEIPRKCNKSNFKCSSVRSVHAPDFSAPERSSRSGIWSIRDDLRMPSSPYFPVNARGPRGPSPMVQERFTSVLSQLLKYRIIRCGGEVNDDMANTIVAQLLCLDAADPTKDIVMYINSPGGSVTAGYAIFDTMRHIRPDISTVCVGLAASMGAFLLGAGTKGKRYSLPSSRIMIHQPLGGAQGSSTDIDVQTDEMLYHKANLTGYLAQFTGHSLMKVYEDTDYDYFMSAKEAKEYGLIDGIILNPLKTLQPLAAAGHNSNNDSSE
ncbi:ATP-dependent Clp protease proteolytic subunit 5-chloroplastic [Striga hermonthica]|uniref:ATP-dependent Clp protease proteolytic subunit n=1 Tax=Striga hermonthica TaxID=68872 RepID=A0A9N7NL11_STRHE|nr:ATP-dependent Clp protease proteolytic subunit 5-chloroplastic [Striga hermonthica]